MTYSPREPGVEPNKRPGDIFTRNSKELLRNGLHFADCIDDLAAQTLLDALNARESIAAYLDEEGRNKLRTKHFRRQISVLAANVRSGLDVEEAAPEGQRARYNDEPAHFVPTMLGERDA